jgi:hypothetical protein
MSGARDATQVINGRLATSWSKFSQIIFSVARVAEDEVPFENDSACVRDVWSDIVMPMPKSPLFMRLSRVLQS